MGRSVRPGSVCSQSSRLGLPFPPERGGPPVPPMLWGPPPSSAPRMAQLPRPRPSRSARRRAPHPGNKPFQFQRLCVSTGVSMVLWEGRSLSWVSMCVPRRQQHRLSGSRPALARPAAPAGAQGGPPQQPSSSWWGGELPGKSAPHPSGLSGPPGGHRGYLLSERCPPAPPLCSQHSLSEQVGAIAQGACWAPGPPLSAPVRPTLSCHSDKGTDAGAPVVAGTPR